MNDPCSIAPGGEPTLGPRQLLRAAAFGMVGIAGCATERHMRRAHSRQILVSVALAMVLPSWAGSQVQREPIPFVGCPADGQVGPLDAPQGTPKLVAVDRGTAGRIAYYKGAFGSGVFAPRGWHCRVEYGSSGAIILITSAAIELANDHLPKAHDHAIELESLSGGTAGRYDLARYASRLFPRVAAKFIERVKSEGHLGATEFVLGPYANDSTRYPDDVTAEFTSPATKRGLGTERNLVPSRDPIRGIAVLDTSGDWSISILRVRLGSSMGQVEAAILELNRECVRSDGC
jgi:hypothetical protein